MKKVLFLCSSNIFRSQMAEAFFNEYSKNNTAESAGLIEKQDHMHRLVVKVIKEKSPSQLLVQIFLTQ